MQSNDGGTARYWAEQGLGLVLRSQWDVEEVVRKGKLVGARRLAIRCGADFDTDTVEQKSAVARARGL